MQADTQKKDTMPETVQMVIVREWEAIFWYAERMFTCKKFYILMTE